MAIKGFMKTTVVYGSSTYVVLCYLKMKGKPTNVADFRKFSLNKVKPSDITRSFDVLVRHNLAKRHSEGHYIITSRGVDYLRLCARKDDRAFDLSHIYPRKRAKLEQETI